VYAALICGAAAIVLIPGSPLGLFTEGVQVLAGVLLPSATVFLLLLCNDSEVLGPWVNGRKTNAFTGTVIAILVTLSVILTASVVFPSITAGQILAIVIACAAAAALGGTAVAARRARRHRAARVTDSEEVIAEHIADAMAEDAADMTDRDSWRMPPLSELSAPAVSGARKIGLTVLRAYLFASMILVIVKLVEVAIGH
jgi:hypothetical protein